MSGLIRLIVKGVVYIVVVFPLVTAIMRNFLGWGWGGFIGFVVAAGLALWLETSGKSNEILAKVFSGGANTQSAAGGSVADIFTAAAPEPQGVETTAKCPNCASNITLINGHGKCEACDHAM